MSIEKELDEHSTAYRVSELRKDRGWKQNELADMIHVTRSQISRLESGETKNIGSDLLVSLAEVFHVSTDYLLGITPITTPKSYEITQLGLSEESVKRLLFRTIDADILNRMMEHRNFPKLCQTIRYYFEDTFVSGIMDRNALLDLASTPMLDIAAMNPEKRVEIKEQIGFLQSQKLGAHEADLDKIRNLFMSIVRDIKSDLEAKTPTSEPITQLNFDSIMQSVAELPTGTPDPIQLFTLIFATLQSSLDMNEETTEAYLHFVEKFMKQYAVVPSAEDPKS